MQSFFMRTTKTDQTAQTRSLFKDFDGCTCHKVHVRFLTLRFIIGIKHGLSCINIRQVLWEVLKTEAEGRGFQHLPRDLANVNALKKPCSIAITA